MIIEVMSKEGVLEYSRFRHCETAAVLSIANCDTPPLCLHDYPDNGIKAQYNARLNDVERDMKNCITDADADEIAAFISEIAEKMDKMIVQCTYGASRSPGVATAVMKASGGDDWSIWRNSKYRPNITCYRAVMKAFRVDIDERELSEKVTVNRNLFEVDLPLFEVQDDTE